MLSGIGSVLLQRDYMRGEGFMLKKYTKNPLTLSSVEIGFKTVVSEKCTLSS
jgi:hypothetical protein